jgi:gliding motility-associated-like protein
MLDLQASAIGYTSCSSTITILDTTGDNPANKVIIISSGTVVETQSTILLVSLTGTVRTYAPLDVSISPSPAFPTNYTVDGNFVNGNFDIIIPAGGHSKDFTVNTTEESWPGDVVFNLIGVPIATYTELAGTLTVTKVIPLKVPNTFTPNGDGTDDTWKITGTIKNAECHVQIFNLWGGLVYSSACSSVWDGTIDGHNLPTGTYYYVIDPGGGGSPIAGYVAIVR